MSLNIFFGIKRTTVKRIKKPSAFLTKKNGL